MSATLTEPATSALPTGARRVAVVLSSLSVEMAAAIFKELSPAEMEAVAAAMSEATATPAETRAAVLREFASQLRGEPEAFEPRRMFERSVGREKALQLMDRASGGNGEEKFFQFLEVIDAAQLVNALRDERPQTLALILCHVNSRRAGELLNKFPEEIQSQVVGRIAVMERIAPEVVRRVETAVKKKLSGVQNGLRNTGGLKAAAEVISNTGRGAEKRILDALNARNTQLAQDVKNLMLVFDDLVKLPDAALQSVLRDVDNNDLCLSLKGAGAPVKEALLRNLSKRAAERMLEELEMMGPKPRSEIDAAQKRIIAVVRKLEEEGKVSIGAGKEDELVA